MKKMGRIFLCSILIFALASCNSAEPPIDTKPEDYAYPIVAEADGTMVSFENYEHLTIGMLYTDACDKLGGSGKMQSSGPVWYGTAIPEIAVFQQSVSEEIRYEEWSKDNDMIRIGFVEGILVVKNWYSPEGMTAVYDESVNMALDKFREIPLACSYEELVGNISGQPHLLQQFVTGTFTCTLYSWYGDGQHTYVHAKFIFLNDVMTEKSIADGGGFLDLKTGAPLNGFQISHENYLKVEEGMSYEEVCAILGSGGLLFQEQITDTVTTREYAWSSDDFCFFVFENDVLVHKSRMQD